jgi:mannosyltransferase OCH1-like enzyme
MPIKKLIHNIWIGPKKIPDGVFKWKEINPECEHILWDEEKIQEEFPGIFSNNIFVNRLYNEKIFHGVSDIMRLYILYRFGGVYFDADCTPLRKLDDEIFNNNFFSVYENESCMRGLVANGVMGCLKKTVLLKRMINNLKSRDLTEPSWIATGPRFLTESLAAYSGQYRIYPSYYFLPEHHTGLKYTGDFKPYCSHFWGSTIGNYTGGY